MAKMTRAKLMAKIRKEDEAIELKKLKQQLAKKKSMRQKMK